MAKILPILIVIVVCGVARAQEFAAPKKETHEIVETPEVSTKIRPSIEGIVKEVFVDKKPWQLVNPVAPVSYGTGEKVVSKDFGPATPYHSSGWVVMGVEW